MACVTGHRSTSDKRLPGLSAQRVWPDLSYKNTPFFTMLDHVATILRTFVYIQDLPVFSALDISARCSMKQWGTTPSVYKCLGLLTL